MRTKMPRVCRLLPVVSVLAFAGCYAKVEDNRPVQVTIAPYEVIQSHIAAQKGKVVVVDCWSTSCDPCIREFPNLVALHKQHATGNDLVCVSVSFDYEGVGKPEDVQPRVLDFLKQQGANFDNFIGREDSDTLFAKFGIPSIPVVFVYDQQGQKAATFGLKGEFTYKEVNDKVAELLGK